MMVLGLIGWNDIISNLRKRHNELLVAIGRQPLDDLFGRVNVIGYELDMGPFCMDLNVNYSMRTKASTE